MTIYEKWALIISVVAIAIPVIQWIWNKWIIRAKLNHYQTGNGYLFINQCGSYLRLQSVYEAINKPISIKKISLRVERERDKQERHYVWSSFVSPTNMQFVGSYTSATETAHPFRIEADNVYCAFTEFGEAKQNAYRILLPKYDALMKKAKGLVTNGISIDKAIEEYCSCREYEDAKQSLEKELFWLIDKYKLTLTVEYGKNKKQFSLSFDVTDEQYQVLLQNIKESLIIPLKDVFGLPRNMQPVQVQIE